MSSIEESVAAWTGILAAVLTIVGLIRSQTWLITISAVFIAASVAAVLYARHERLRLKAASIKIEGRSIDSLNLGNLKRRVSKTLVVQEVRRVATIDGEDLKITSVYSGYCRARRETEVEFGIDADTNTPFEELGCWGFDLLRDPEMKHPIRPILRSSDGSSKKIGVPLLQPVGMNQAFKVMLRCTLPGCMKTGIEYYAAAVSFDQDRIPHSRVSIVFNRGNPDWLRVYEVDSVGSVCLVREIQREAGGHHAEYVDVAEEIPGQAARVYLFHRAMEQSSRPLRRAAAHM